jgi:membrane-bound serine protease (ClpP class)
VLGAAAVGFEVLFWPGHGALAVLGVLFIVGSLIGALLDLRHVPLEISWSLGWVTRALVRVFGSVLATGVAMVVVARLVPSTRFGRALVLERAITEQAGPAQTQARAATGGVGDALVGRSGTAETALRPAGKALVGGRRIDVVTEGDFIEAGTRVVVVALDGSRIVVRRQGA